MISKDTYYSERDACRDSKRASPGPLKIAVLIKQVPVAEELELGPDGRIRRDGMDLEMNAYCRRAVSKGVELARATAGSTLAVTLGPLAAQDVLLEAIAYGIDGGLHLCDAEFAGSDTLVTARALAEALRKEGPFDLILAGRNSLDGDTGQVPPELAELLGMPFACGARELHLEGRSISMLLEQDDGWVDVEVSLPAVVSVAERLCEPAKVGPEGRRSVPKERIRTMVAAELGEGPWGMRGSPTMVGAVRVLPSRRLKLRLPGSVESQAEAAVRKLAELGALGAASAGSQQGQLEASAPQRSADVLSEPGGPAVDSAYGQGLPASPSAGQILHPAPLVAAVLDPGRPVLALELVSGAASLASCIGGRVVAIAVAEDPFGWEMLELYGVSELVQLEGSTVEEDVAGAVRGWALQAQPWAILAASTAYGREVASRVAAGLGCGLVGDAVALSVSAGRMVAAKPAFSGALIADITSSSKIQIVTVRPGVLATYTGCRQNPQTFKGAVYESLARTHLSVPGSSRMKILSVRRDDDLEALAHAQVVIGVGSGMSPDEYGVLDPLVKVLGAELAATRKVTDRSWMPRSRQVGITGKTIGPRLYLAVALSGKFNHMAGVRSAGTVLAVNSDPSAPVFDHADLGMVADFHEAIPALVAALKKEMPLYHTAQHPLDGSCSGSATDGKVPQAR